MRGRVCGWVLSLTPCAARAWAGVDVLGRREGGREEELREKQGRREKVRRV